MADRDLEVNVNVGGKDNLTPALERQKKLIEDLAAAEANLTKLRKDYGAGGAELILADLRQQLAAERAITGEVQKRMTIGGGRPPPTPPPGSPGGGGVRPLSERSEARELAHAQAQMVAPSPNAALAVERQGLKDEAAERLAERRNRETPLIPRNLQTPAGYAPAPLPNAQLGEARQVARAEADVRRQLADEEQQRQLQRVRNIAYARVTGRIPDEEVRRAGGQRQGAGAVVGGVAMAGAGVLHGGGHEYAGVASALSAIPGPAGAVASAAVILASAFREARLGVEAHTAAQRTALDDLNRARGTGTTGGTELRRHLSTAEQTEYAAAEARGDEAGMRRILMRAHTRLQGAAGTGGGPQQVAELQAELERIEDETSSPETNWLQESAVQTALRLGGLGSLIRPRTRSERRREAFRRRGLEVPEFTDAPASREQIRQWSGLGGTAYGLTSGAGVTGAALRAPQGMLPSLDPTRELLRDLPNLFRSHQLDIGDVHSQVQQEVVRDQRQQAQFQSLMERLDRILGALSNPTAPGGGGSNPFAGLPWWAGGEIPASPPW